MRRAREQCDATDAQLAALQHTHRALDEQHRELTQRAHDAQQHALAQQQQQAAALARVEAQVRDGMQQLQKERTDGDERRRAHAADAAAAQRAYEQVSIVNCSLTSQFVIHALFFVCRNLTRASTFNLTRAQKLGDAERAFAAAADERCALVESDAHQRCAAAAQHTRQARSELQRERSAAEHARAAHVAAADGIFFYFSLFCISMS